MDSAILRWVIGLVLVSGLLGWLVTTIFLGLLRQYITQKNLTARGVMIFLLDVLRGHTTDSTARGVMPWLTGVVERTFFTVAIGLGLSGGALAGMLIWVTFKYYVNWQRRQGRPDLLDRYMEKVPGLSGLLGSLVSLFFAFIGGCICRGHF